MIIYEPHPVSPERKAQLRAQGFKIIDAAFKPVDYVEPVSDAPQAETPPVPVKRGRPPKVAR
jgi:hypothetical protein